MVTRTGRILDIFLEDVVESSIRPVLPVQVNGELYPDKAAMVNSIRKTVWS